ncbi:MAG: hypothetical protein JSU94_03100, partial [Phycisphaerales bacterium]
MKACLSAARLVGLAVFFGLCVSAPAAEKLGRGLVAVRREDGSVFLSWRLLAEDPDDMAFQVVRIRGGISTPDQWAYLTGIEPY